MNTQNNTNCLALTIKKEYRLTVARNATLKFAKLTSKVLLGVITLNFINLII